jgi:acyl-CoA reductase-like NAD-dependent aldehyde dehydrogenase
VACIIGAWNYPIQLLLAPFVGALSAGTSCILKPSELSPHVASLLTTLLPRYLDARHYRVLLGETIETTTAILDQGMDLVFYTGGGRVARVIAERVAKHLTPCVFELGGKSPAVVLPDAKDLATVSKRLCWGR